jgi:hypothetical protein
MNEVRVEARDGSPGCREGQGRVLGHERDRLFVSWISRG